MEFNYKIKWFRLIIFHDSNLLEQLKIHFLFEDIIG